MEPGRVSSSGLKQQKISGIFREIRRRDSKGSFGSKREVLRNLTNNLSEQNKSDVKESKGTLYYKVLNIFVTKLENNLIWIAPEV